MILPISDLNKALLSFLNKRDFLDLEGDILINFAYQIEEINLISFIELVLSDNKKVFYFNKPEEGLTFLAFGNTFSIKMKGENKFRSLGEKISAISRRSINNFNEVSSIEFPLFLGGTKFCTRKNSDEWEDFADNDWFIPLFLFYKKKNEYWVIINFFVTNNYLPEDLVNRLLEPLNKLDNKECVQPNGTTGIKICTIETERQDWYNLINDATSKIEEELFRKVVISRRTKANIKNYPSFNHVLHNFQENYNNCTIFLFKSENSIIFGATPEQLIKLNVNEVEFDALAGSAKRGETEEDDNKIECNLLKDKKNIEEHNHVIKFITDASLKYVKNFIQSDTRIKKFSNIQHIYTPIKAELKSNEQIYYLVDAIFPTPAICGYPKKPSYDYIIENENFDRGLFSGVIGCISQGQMDLVVAIRSALLNNNNLYIYAGCGIVKGSDPISEFEETEIKMKPILSLFNYEN